MLLEPIQGETGVHVLSDDLLRAARQVCDEAGAALIFDEVQCGMGRTGSLWAYEQTGVIPDAFTAAKGLAGGLPMGALVTGERLADVFAPGDHGSTFGGGPVVAAAALATLEVIDDVELLERVRELGERLRSALAALPHVNEVRGRGLLVACEVDVSAPEVVGVALAEQQLVVNATGPSTVRLMPPLIVEEADCNEALARLAAALERAPPRLPRGVSSRMSRRKVSGGFELDDDPERVDLDAVHAFLAHEPTGAVGDRRRCWSARSAGPRASSASIARASRSASGARSPTGRPSPTSPTCTSSAPIVAAASGSSWCARSSSGGPTRSSRGCCTPPMRRASMRSSVSARSRRCIR